MKRNIPRAVKYGAAILAFAMLVASALWLPQVFFDVSDTLAYGKISLMEQEKLDVLTLNTGYEESLYKRLAGFAEGLAGQRQYYVDEQPKEVTEEIKEFLFESELRFGVYGIFEDVVMNLFAEGLGFTAGEFSNRMKTGYMESELYQWKQYVVYSDDYAQGVNFILWCFSLRNKAGDDMTILMDAHDHTVYAVQMTGGMGLQYSVPHVEGSYYEENQYLRGAVWMGLDVYYDIFGTEELDRFFSSVVEIYDEQGLQQTEKIAGILSDTAGNGVEIYLRADSDIPYGADGEEWYGKDTSGVRHYSLPLGENKMTFGVYGFEKPYYTAPQDTVSAMGIREIFRLIPEFQNIV